MIARLGERFEGWWYRRTYGRNGDHTRGLKFASRFSRLTPADRALAGNAELSDLVRRDRAGLVHFEPVERDVEELTAALPDGCPTCGCPTLCPEGLLERMAAANKRLFAWTVFCAVMALLWMGTAVWLA